jgi:hypothetical protein
MLPRVQQRPGELYSRALRRALWLQYATGAVHLWAAGVKEGLEDGWTLRDVLATEQGAASLESVIEYHCQAGMDQMAGDKTQPAAKLDVLREGKTVKKAMLAEVERVI